MASWRKVVVSGSDANLKSLVVSQSLNATSITGSLLGSAQSAEMVVINSTTAPTSSLSGSLWFNTNNLTLYVRYTDPSGSSFWVPTYNAGIPVTASYAESSSLADLAHTASYLNGSVQSASYATSAAYAPQITLPTTYSQAYTASFVNLAQTASYVVTALTASYFNLPATYSQAFTASFVTIARTASYVQTAQTASFVDSARTASFVDTAQTASRVAGSNVVGIVAQAYTASYVATAQTASYFVMSNRPAFRVVGTGGAMNSSVLSGSKLTVDFNQGTHFDVNTGWFTAPIAGLYQTNLVIRTANNTNTVINQAAIYKSSSAGEAVQAMIEFGPNTSMNHAGASSIVSMAVGDRLKAVILVGSCSFDINDNFSAAYIG